MHGRAVLSVCNLRLLDLKQRLMYIKGTASKPGTDHPAGLYLWQIEPEVRAMPAVPVQVTTGRTGSWEQIGHVSV